MLNENFVYLALVITSIGGISYLLDTIKGKAKPNRVTWFLWGAIPMIAFIAQLNQGVGIQSLLTFVAGFIPFLILVASILNREAYWQISRLDLTCGGISIFGVILWLLTSNPNLGILFFILADGMAGLPTVIKAYNEPETESYFAFFATAVASVITLSTIKEWSFATYSFSLYLLIINTLLAVLIKFGLGKKVSKVVH